jgi:hypothetical protein
MILRPVEDRVGEKRGFAAGSWGVFLGAVLLGLGVGLAASEARAVSCTTQAELKPDERRSILETGNALAGDISTQNYDGLQGSLMPAVISEWEGMKSVAQSAKPLIEGGKMDWGNAYLLDATDLKGPADTQFFCTNADSSVTVTINLRSLPPGRYTLLLGDATGAPLAGQLAFILGTDAAAGGKWKLGGIFVREGALDGHDGVWYWTQARKLASSKAAWSAWYEYDAARWLLLPVDFLSSPHLEKLNREQQQTGSNPAESLPITVTGDGGKSWKVTGLRLDTALHHDDLGLAYESTGPQMDPAAQRAEAIAVMSGLLKTHPELRANFHGLWAYAERDGQRSYAVELAMQDIP